MPGPGGGITKNGGREAKLAGGLLNCHCNIPYPYPSPFLLFGEFLTIIFARGHFTFLQIFQHMDVSPYTATIASHKRLENKKYFF
jgi:hypothetical protein